MTDSITNLVDTVICGDCLEVMKDMPDNCVDLVLTDPPYGIGYKSGHTKPDGSPRKADASFGDDRVNNVWIHEAYRVLKDNTAAYIFSRWDVLHATVQVCKAAGFQVKQRIVWDKGHWGTGDLAYYLSQVEEILFVIKGRPTLRDYKQQGNIWRENGRLGMIGIDGDFGHPTQKPTRLLKKAIIHSSKEGDVVLDPFFGVGSTGVAAVRMGRHFIGIEISPDYCKIAEKRIQEERDKYALFDRAKGGEE